MKMRMSRCRWFLLTLWLVFSAVLFLIIFVQTVFSSSVVYSKAAFSWLMPSVIPTLSLMFGVVAADSVGSRDKDRPEVIVDSTFFKVTYSVSLFYLVLLLLVLLLQPLSEQSRPASFTESNYFLGPIQGLVAGLIGAFFVKNTSQPPRS